MSEYTVVKDALGERWYKKGTDLLHRGGGLPAVIYSDGGCEWWLEGKASRLGGLPALVWPCGYKAWFVDGLRNRNHGLPAIIRSDGSKEWWVSDQRHRGGDLPAVVNADGSMEWWVLGEYVGKPDIIKEGKTPHAHLLKSAC